jgi:hypothetical protein
MGIQVTSFLGTYGDGPSVPAGGGGNEIKRAGPQRAEAGEKRNWRQTASPGARLGRAGNVVVMAPFALAKR